MLIRCQIATGRVGQTSADPRLAAAIVDRLTFNPVIVETSSESDRLRATRSPKTGVPYASCTDRLTATPGTNLYNRWATLAEQGEATSR